MLPKANEELSKDNPVVLLNEGLSSAKISKPSVAHSVAQGTMQQAIGCDRKGKGMHGLIIVKSFWLIKKIVECLKMNLNGSFLELPAEEKINAHFI